MAGVSVRVEGIPQAQALVQTMNRQAKPLTLSGLREGVQQIVNVAKQNAAATFRGTGRLEASLDVLGESMKGETIEIVAGSKILGYPFYQEYGWTTRTGRKVQGRLYFTRAIEQVRGQVPELLVTRVYRQLPGGK